MIAWIFSVMLAFNGARVSLVDIVLEEVSEEEIWESSSRVSKVTIPLQLSDWWDAPPKLFMDPCHNNISNVRSSTILLIPLFFLIKVRTPLELSPKLLKHWNVTLFCHCVASITFKMVQWCHASKWWPMPRTFWMQRVSNNCKGSRFSPKYPVLGVNMTIQEEVGFIRKPDIIREFLVIFVFIKTTGTWLHSFPYQLGSVGAWSGSGSDSLRSLIRNVAQKPRRTLADYFLNPNDTFEYSVCYRRSRLWWSSQVLWVTKFLTNLKIWFLLGNVLKLNSFLYLTWTTLEDFVS